MQKRVEGNFNCSGNLNSRQSWRVNYAKNSNDNFCTILYCIKFESRIENIRTILISIIIPIILPFSRHSSFWESTLTFSPLPSWTTFPFLFIPFLPSFPLFLLHSYSIKHAKELNRSGSISSQSQARMPTVLLHEYFNECGSSDARDRLLFFPQCFPSSHSCLTSSTTLIFPFFEKDRTVNAQRNKERKTNG